ncbi:putative ABC transport system permease protein [Streptacidiphilus sp. MAP12-20]|uniref:ABC transporter permease n=1 Tax=Streptacidiphilus sp. MAP12-20 TaxID=3156299 RepID=UPI003511369C
MSRRSNPTDQGTTPRRGSAMGRVVRSGVARRRVQAIVMGVAAMVAVTAMIVAGSLMIAASAPFDHAFAQQHGPHVIAQIDESKAGAAQITATGRLAGVTGTAGPYRTVTLNPLDSNGNKMGTLTMVGRSTAGGALDDLTLDSGHWATEPGEVVLSTDFENGPFALGAKLSSSDSAGATALTIVGFARSVSQSAEGWLAPAQVDAFRAAGAPGTVQMMYRFASAGTTAQINADREELGAALPTGALLGAQSYLDTRLAADESSAAQVPFITAIGALGLLMSVIIVASVVSGAVGASLRRIGILKSIGFTPGQVVRAYVAQALIPTAVGAAAGVLLGNALVLPLLHDAQQAFGTGALSVTWWVSPVAPLAVLSLVALSALAPALRAGRLRTVDVIATGRTPRGGRGQRAHGVSPARRAWGGIAARLPLPRPVTLGLAAPFARPVRTAGMLAAVVFGTMAATFAVGLTSSLSAIGVAESPGSGVAVIVDTGGHGLMTMQHPKGSGAVSVKVTSETIARVGSVVAAQSGTASSYGMAITESTAQGVSGAVRTTLYQGDSSLTATELVAGHWLTGPGQVVLPTHFLQSSGKRIGDALTLTVRGESVSLRIVGEAFAPANGGMNVFAELSDFSAVRPAIQVELYGVTLKPGVSAQEYAAPLNTALEPLGAQVIPGGNGGAHASITMLEAMAGLLTLMLVVVAGLGVLNAVVLDTRERVRDLGVCKALGMTPRQTIAQVLASVAGLGVVGGIIGVPAGVALHVFVMPIVGQAAGTGLTTPMLSVYQLGELGLLGLGGVTIALLGAMAPAGWAAKVRTAVALRTE